jgi:hypothetical protein
VLSLVFIVPFGTMELYGAGDAGQGPTAFFLKGITMPSGREHMERIEGLQETDEGIRWHFPQVSL